jgi:hypothetical protein
MEKLLAIDIGKNFDLSIMSHSIVLKNVTPPAAPPVAGTDEDVESGGLFKPTSLLEAIEDEDRSGRSISRLVSSPSHLLH